jgi:hypothetical protein
MNTFNGKTRPSSNSAIVSQINSTQTTENTQITAALIYHSHNIHFLRAEVTEIMIYSTQVYSAYA